MFICVSVSFACDIASALSYIASRGIAHLDLKPSNIIVTAFDDHCQLTDFGCSVRTGSPYDDDDLLPVSLIAPANGIVEPRTAGAAGGAGTIVYRAPELFQTSNVVAVGPKALAKADIYSFGVTLWQLVERRNPFADYPSDSTSAIIYAVVEFGARPDGSRGDGGRWTDQLIESTFADSESAYEALYLDCWQGDVEWRPSADELLRRLDRCRRACRVFE